VVFFRDLTQIIGILLQIGIWVTPIMWNMDTLADFPDWLKFVFRLNPMYYIVSGYRDAMLNETWFWQHGWWTLYFWVFALVCLLGGTGVFRKLKVHFADVL
jgi:teichoic acid transport system permease protein